MTEEAGFTIETQMQEDFEFKMNPQLILYVENL